MAGGLRQPHVPGNHRGKDLAREVALDLLRHLEGEVGPAIVHGQQQPLQGDGGVQPPLHDADGGQQVAEAFQGIVFALDRHQHGIRRAQAVEGEQFQGGGAVNEDEVIVCLHLGQGVLQPILPAVQGDHLHRSPGQPFVGRQHIAVLGVDDGVLHRCAADENVVNGGKHRPLIHAKARGGVALGVKVAHQDLCPGLLQAGGQVHAAGGFPHPAFLVDKGDGFGHGFPSFPEPCGSCELVTG